MAKGKQSKGKSQKPLPDIAKLGKAKPTRIPRLTKTVEQVIAPPAVNWQLFWIFFAMLVPLVAIAYGNTLFGQLVFNDPANFDTVMQAQNTENFWLMHWANTVAKPLSQGYVTATYAWDTKSFNWNAGWSHLVNAVLHLFTCFYLYVLVFRLSWRCKNEDRLQANPYILAFAAAALFAIHPLTTGSVAYISGREAPLMAMNYFLALNAFVFGFLSENLAIALVGYLVCFIFTAISIFCGPQGITIPFTAVVLGLLLKSPSLKWKEWLMPRSAEIAMFAAAAIGLPFILRTGSAKLLDNGVGLSLLSPPAYWATQMKSLLTYYLRCTIVPFGLSPDPPYIVASAFGDPLAILGLIIVVAAAVGIWLYRKKPMIVFGIELFLIGLLPASLIVQREIVADQRFYLSLAGLCILIGWVTGHFFQTHRKNTIIAASCVLVLFSGLTIYRNEQWKTDQSLWDAGVKTNPSSTRALAMAAQAMTPTDKVDKALSMALDAVHHDPDSAFALRTLGRCYMFKDNFQKAAETFEQAVAVAEKQGTPEKDVADYQRDLARAYASLKQLDKAEAVAQKALRYLPDDPYLHLILGRMLLEQKQYAKAYMQLVLGFKHDPGNPEFLQPIAEAGVNSGIVPFVRQSYPAAVRLEQINPTRENAMLVARAALALGSPNEAVNKLMPWLTKNKNDAEVLYLLSAANEKLGNNADAAKYKDLATKLDPNVSKKVPIPAINMDLKPVPPNKAAAPTVQVQPQSVVPTPSAPPTQTASPTQPASPTYKPQGQQH